MNNIYTSVCSSFSKNDEIILYASYIRVRVCVVWEREEGERVERVQRVTRGKWGEESHDGVTVSRWNHIRFEVFNPAGPLVLGQEAQLPSP